MIMKPWMTFRSNFTVVVFMLMFSLDSILAESSFGFRVSPNYHFPIDDPLFEPSFGSTLTLDYNLNPNFGLLLEGEYINLTPQDLASLTLLGASIGADAKLLLGDRFTLQADIMAGIYTASSDNGNIAGVSAGTRLSGTVNITPGLSATLNGAYKYFAYTPEPLLDSFSVGIVLSINFTEVFVKKNSVNIKKSTEQPIFPVFYSWYNENPFGEITITNNERNRITDINVNFFLEQYMKQPKECTVISSLLPGESVTVPLTAFFNESMLELNENIVTQAQIIVDYRRLSQKKTITQQIKIPVFNRNAMSWEDDRRAAAFVSSKDPAALWFSKYAISIVSDQFRNTLNKNLQYAMGLFEALNVYGMNYVIDPSSSYAEIAGNTSSIDFLQYPYQTLMYRGGDCDDLSILYCSLLEAVGIETAFVTIPGHIFMAFDSGMAENEAKSSYYAPDQLIYHDNKAWFPVEITLIKEGFNKAWKIGVKEWYDANSREVAKLFPMHKSWELYKPISVPGAESKFNLPEEKQTILALNKSLDKIVQNVIAPIINEKKALLSKTNTKVSKNSTGVLYGKNGMLEQAKKEFIVAAGMNYIHAWINLGNIFFMEEDYTTALEYYSYAINRKKNNSLALLGAARSSYELDDFFNSDSFYLKLSDINPKLAKEYGYLGSFYETSGRAYSLADRLTTTIWSPPPESIFGTVEELKIIAEDKSIKKDGLSSIMAYSEIKEPIITMENILAKAQKPNLKSVFESPEIRDTERLLVASKSSGIFEKTKANNVRQKVLTQEEISELSSEEIAKESGNSFESQVANALKSIIDTPANKAQEEVEIAKSVLPLKEEDLIPETISTTDEVTDEIKIAKAIEPDIKEDIISETGHSTGEVPIEIKIAKAVDPVIKEDIISETGHSIDEVPVEIKIAKAVDPVIKEDIISETGHSTGEVPIEIKIAKAVEPVIKEDIISETGSTTGEVPVEIKIAKAVDPVIKEDIISETGHSTGEVSVEIKIAKAVEPVIKEDIISETGRTTGEVPVEIKIAKAAEPVITKTIIPEAIPAIEEKSEEIRIVKSIEPVISEIVSTIEEDSVEIKIAKAVEPVVSETIPAIEEKSEEIKITKSIEPVIKERIISETIPSTKEDSAEIKISKAVETIKKEVQINSEIVESKDKVPTFNKRNEVKVTKTLLPSIESTPETKILPEKKENPEINIAKMIMATNDKLMDSDTLTEEQKVITKLQENRELLEIDHMETLFPEPEFVLKLEKKPKKEINNEINGADLMTKLENIIMPEPVIEHVPKSKVLKASAVELVPIIEVESTTEAEHIIVTESITKSEPVSNIEVTKELEPGLNLDPVTEVLTKEEIIAETEPVVKVKIEPEPKVEEDFVTEQDLKDISPPKPPKSRVILIVMSIVAGITTIGASVSTMIIKRLKS